MSSGGGVCCGAGSGSPSQTMRPERTSRRCIRLMSRDRCFQPQRISAR